MMSMSKTKKCIVCGKKNPCKWEFFCSKECQIKYQKKIGYR